MKLNSLRSLALLVPILAASGCTIINTDGDLTDCTFGCPGESCSDDSDCHDSCTCQSGVCTRRPPAVCTSNSQCGSGNMCLAG
ncbi:MAG: hypothetical protein JNM17_35190, partial [Archangium sp.]|nr:hypothetical protein [Archangium sp.]